MYIFLAISLILSLTNIYFIRNNFILKTRLENLTYPALYETFGLLEKERNIRAQQMAKEIVDLEEKSLLKNK